MEVTLDFESIFSFSNYWCYWVKQSNYKIVV